MLPFTIIVNHSYNNKKINCHFKCLLCPFKCSVNLFNSPIKLHKIIFNLLDFPFSQISHPTLKHILLVLPSKMYSMIFWIYIKIYISISQYCHPSSSLTRIIKRASDRGSDSSILVSPPVYAASLQRILLKDGVTLLLKTFNNCPSCWGKYQVLTVGKTQYL